MFASPGNAQLQKFVARWPHHQATAVNSLECSLENFRDVYANPPWKSILPCFHIMFPPRRVRKFFPFSLFRRLLRHVFCSFLRMIMVFSATNMVFNKIFSEVREPMCPEDGYPAHGSNALVDPLGYKAKPCNLTHAHSRWSMLPGTTPNKLPI